MMKVAQTNLAGFSKQLGLRTNELFRRSTMIFKITPEQSFNAGISIDLIELCSSDLAAQPECASASRESEKDRKYAAEAFNSLSQSLILKSGNKPSKSLFVPLQ